MRYELYQEFFFEAAHTLQREASAERDGSRRVHGHTYHARVSVSGEPDPATGMVRDLGSLRAMVAAVRDKLDHRMLNDIEGLGPPTLENLCAYLWRAFEAQGLKPARVVVSREGMKDGCTLTSII